MAEIQTLHEVFRKEGLQFIHKLFSNSIVISEKLNATRFCFSIDNDNNFHFFKKDGPITLIDRTMSRIYEDPINYITSLSSDVIEKLPKNYRFGFRYFHTENPINITYDKIPKNGLILTDLQNHKSKLIDYVDILNPIADLLDVSKPPVIWHGTLDSNQKAKLLEYLRSSEDFLKSKFSTSSFTKYIISILNPSLKTTALNNDLEQPIDSIIFKFIGTDEIIYAKAVDPIVNNLIKTNEAEREPQDMYSIILSDIVEWLKIHNLDEYILHELTSDDRYLELINRLYNKYITTNGFRYNGVELDNAAYRNSPSYDVNDTLIKNPKTIQNINTSDINKKIYKIFVASIQKPRKRPIGMMSQLLVDDLQKISSKIKEICSITIDENYIPTFEEYITKIK